MFMFMWQEIAFRNVVPRRLLAMWGFFTLYFDLVTNEIEGKIANLLSSQFVKTVKIAGG